MPTETEFLEAFQDDLRRAQKNLQLYYGTGDSSALAAAADACERILSSPVFSTTDQCFQLVVFDTMGGVLLQRYRSRRQFDDLDRALRYWQQAVEHVRRDSPKLPILLAKLATALSDRFECIGQPEDLDAAIGFYRQAVQETPLGSTSLPGHLYILGHTLRDRYTRNEWLEDLEEAIRVFQRAVAITPPDSPYLPSILNELGISLILRYERGRQLEDLDEAIRVSQQAVQQTPPDSPDLPSILNMLGRGLHDRYERSRQLEDLEEAIRVSQQAVQQTPPDSPDLPSILNMLGRGLRDRYAHSGRIEDLEEAIRVSQQAVDLTKLDSPNLPSILNSLGLGLRDRYAFNGRLEDLEESIRHLQKAVEMTPPNSPDLSSRLNNLGTGLSARFAHNGRLEDLEEAIRDYQRAVAATPPDSPDLPKYLNNLGNGWADRYTRSRQLEDLEEAIRFHRQAVDRTALDSSDAPRHLSSLGNDLGYRYTRSRRIEDLEEAISFRYQAVQLMPSDSPDLPALLNSLGLSLCDRYARSRRIEDLEEAIRNHQQAVDLTKPDSPNLPMYLNNLGNSLSDRYPRNKRTEDLTGAGSHYRRACQLGTRTAPQEVLRAASNWGRWALERQAWAEVAEAYGYGLATGRLLLARQMGRAQKESWLRDLKKMPAPAAYALARLGKLEGAVETVERSRARLLAEALERNRRDLERLPFLGHEDLYRRYREIVETQNRLTQPGTARPDQPVYLSSQARLDAIVAANVAFDQVVADIQKLSGYADFLAEPTFAQIQEATQATPLVYLLTMPAGGLALIVYNGQVQPVWLDELTDASVREWLDGADYPGQLGGWLGTYQTWLTQRTKQDQLAWFATLEAVTRQLWERVMGPVAAALHELLPADPASPLEVILIPAGLLALLPLHAAWREDTSTATGRRYFLDEFVVRYAPSAVALRHAQEVAERTPAVRLLAVEEPALANVKPLPSAHLEVAAIASLFDPPTILAGGDAMRQTVQAALPEAQVVHFACHGANDWQNPLESGLLMADDASRPGNLLRVLDLLELAGAGGRLATLSACETGIVGTALPDEVVALPSALLQAHFGGIVASLWSVADISTAMLIAHFYHQWQEEKLAPAQALRAAQRWLRDTTNAEKGDYFKRYSPELSGEYVSGLHMPEAVALDFFSETMSREIEHRDFEHPFWWAAFYLTGV